MVYANYTLRQFCCKRCKYTTLTTLTTLEK